MLTVETQPPTDLATHLAEARFTATSLIVDLRDPAAPWLQSARAGGATVFASRGFDPTEQWGDEALHGLEGTDVWMLNDLEARAFTGLEDPAAAARLLAERVPLVIVTRGADGMVAADGSTGAEAVVPAFAVTPLNTTGAGDSTLAAFAFAHRIPDASLEDRLNLSAFIASAVLASPAGAGTPPSLEELHRNATRGTDPRHARIAELLEGNR